ncbi:hypothetical protein PPL_10765 [Heterostelium album PN500]|uniref:Uncharacterized protein n=1 Tax=Heterostelium pallidum (strain ATCC 26659 / Pp 5 / PN500) TaxID=670386 RepID=D3BRX5_HETP5|nr:hypothetical protein PPL_10765 [Heterostelium album PN500]EFA75712.1 hypothetical protein PPL_10765 [Heterostelium album PN500]|eukprot:XP_020427846.1 hypothetical protein PPL_10765 [Heterostelium album PN500]
MISSGCCGCGNHSCDGCCSYSIKQLTLKLENVTNQLDNLTKEVAEIRASKVTTQVVPVPKHSHSISSLDFTAIPGSQTSVTVTRPSKLVAFVSYHSKAKPNTSVDITSALNGTVMTLGGYTDYPWPLGASLNINDFVNGASITEQVVQPGVYNYDIRARIRPANAGDSTSLANGFAALLVLIPL